MTNEEWGNVTALRAENERLLTALNGVRKFADWIEEFANESQQYSDGKNFAAGKIEGSRGTARTLREILARATLAESEEVTA